MGSRPFYYNFLHIRLVSAHLQNEQTLKSFSTKQLQEENEMRLQAECRSELSSNLSIRVAISSLLVVYSKPLHSFLINLLFTIQLYIFTNST